jgi:hypothetical protein
MKKLGVTSRSSVKGRPAMSPGRVPGAATFPTGFVASPSVVAARGPLSAARYPSPLRIHGAAQGILEEMLAEIRQAVDTMNQTSAIRHLPPTADLIAMPCRSAFSLSPARRSLYRSQSPVRGSMPAVYSAGRRPAPAVLFGTWSPSMSTLPPRGRAQLPLSTSSTLLRGRILPARRSPVRMRILSPPPRLANPKAAILADGKGRTNQEWQDYVRANYPNHELAELDSGTIVSRPALTTVYRTVRRLVSRQEVDQRRQATEMRRQGIPTEMDKVDTSGWTLEDDLRFGCVGPPATRNR